MSKFQVLFCTTNPGKVEDTRRFFESSNIPVTIKTPADLGIDIDVVEDRDTLQGNAEKKLRTFLDLPQLHNTGNNWIIMSDDSGFFIDALNGEPGIKARRWNGTQMTDEEMISYGIEQMKHVPDGNRQALFRSVIALGFIIDNKPSEIEYYDGTLQGRILVEADKLRVKGFPFESFFVVTEGGQDILLGKFFYMSDEERANYHFETHRQKAMKKALERISSVIKS